MSTRPATVDPEEIQTTRSEKLLGVVLAVFLLIGAMWAYDRLGELGRGAVDASVSAEDRSAVERLDVAETRAAQAASEERVALDLLVRAREAYRTALDADRPAERLRLAYEERQRALAAAEAETRLARSRATVARPAALAASERIAEEEESVRGREALLAFVLRFAFAAALLAVGIWLLGRLRRIGSRWFPLAFSLVGTAAVLAFVLAGDYVYDYVDPLDLGPLVLSLVGIALTLVGFAALQRYLARRIPVRRVRKGECPFCGYPAGQGDHCEGCGRELVAGCARCAQPRRVGTLHCRACGET